MNESVCVKCSKLLESLIRMHPLTFTEGPLAAKSASFSEQSLGVLQGSQALISRRESCR